MREDDEDSYDKAVSDKKSSLAKLAGSAIQDAARKAERERKQREKEGKDRLETANKLINSIPSRHKEYR